MGIFGFSILPREDKFYQFFENLAENCVKSVDLISQLACHSADEAERGQIGKQIADLKKIGKDQYEELAAQLCRSFITPFDREDLLQIGSILYRSTKLVEKIKNRILIHRVLPYQEDFQRLTKIIRKDAVALQALVRALNRHHLTDVQKANTLLHEYEDSADDMLEHLVFDLCRADLPAAQVMLRKDLYEMFERLTDLYRDCGNITLQIILKHS